MIKKSKKILSLLLSLLMIISMSAVLEISSVAEDDILSYLEYEINDGEVTITDCDESISGDVVIPDTIEGYPVIKIGIYAFYRCHSLTGVTIGKSVKIIDKTAFIECNNLESITVDESNSYYLNDEYGVLFNKDKSELIKYPIGNSRSEYTIPDSVITICDYAFFNCNNIVSITIPDSVTTIGYESFYNSANLASVTIGNSVTTIGEAAFSWCNSLASVTIGNSVSRIFSFAFHNCPNLKFVIIPDSVSAIGNKSLGYYVFGYDYKLIKDFVIYGTPDTSAETYANENGITFISVGGEESTTKEPVTDAPTTEKPSERPTEKTSTDGPAIDGPATDGPTEKPTEKPVSEKLEVSDKNIKVDEKGRTVTLGQKNTVEDISKVIKNSKTAIFGKDGKELGKSDLVGTGSKIRVMDNSGKILNEYTVCVPNDVDGNGKTTAADARLALRGSAKLEKLEGVYALASDVSGDGKITAADARKILRISAGLEKA